MPSPTINEDVEWYEKIFPNYKDFTKTVEKIIFELLRVEDVNYAILQSRVKDPKSYRNKLDTISYSGREMKDLAGVRIVGYVQSDVEKISKIIRNDFHVNEKQTKNKSDELNPDQFGYSALHLICCLSEDRLKLLENKNFKGLVVEIQIKTILEHTWAEIEHDRNYKYKIIPRSLKRDFFQTKALLDVADQKFEHITQQIDSEEKTVQKQTKLKDLHKMDITPFNVKRYLIEKFSNELDFKPIFGLKDGKGNKEIEEIKNFKIKNIEELEKKLNQIWSI